LSTSVLCSTLKLLVTWPSQGWCAESCSVQPVPTIQLLDDR